MVTHPSRSYTQRNARINSAIAANHRRHVSEAESRAPWPPAPRAANAQLQSSYRSRRFSHTCPHPRPSTPLCSSEAVCPRADRGEGSAARSVGGVEMSHQAALARERYRAVPSRWETEFGRWVADVGVARIVKALADDPDLRVTNQAVYEWLQGHAPRPARAMALVELSGGHLTLEAIYGHGREMRSSPSEVTGRRRVGTSGTKRAGSGDRDSREVGDI